MRVGNSSDGYLNRSFVKILQLPNIGSGSEVIDAKLNLYLVSGTSTYSNIDIYRVNSAWNTSTITWTIHSGLSKTLISSNNSPSSMVYRCNVTNTVQSWYSGTTNHGFMVRYTNELVNDWNSFNTANFTGSSTLKPFITITYISSEHAQHYNKLSLWSIYKWPYSSGPDGTKVYIKYYYEPQGVYDYSNRISNAARNWENIFTLSPFRFTRVYNINDANLVIYSNNYGETTWTGSAYFYVSPKRIQLNEWFHLNHSHYDFLCYEITTTHEMGHTHLLDHYECNYEIMRPQHIHVMKPYDGDIQGIRDIY